MKKVKHNYGGDGADNTSGAGTSAHFGNNDNTQGTSDAYDRYAGMNRDQLMGEMYKEAAKSRASGMSNDDLESFYGKVAPAMNEEQRANLRSLIEKLKV